MKPVLPDSFTAVEAEITACRLCPRLVAWREQTAGEKRRAYRDWLYWGKGVPGFGDPQAAILVVGLAPGAHGSNRTGRMFTGDSSGDFLYAALHRAGFASQPTAAHREDGLRLRNMFISAVCRCAPPENKPSPGELTTCRPYLLREMHLLQPLQGVVALGRIAFDALFSIYQVKDPAVTFAHGAFYRLGEQKPWLLASYHPSRQNTQTGRLTPAMFDQIWQTARHNLL